MQTISSRRQNALVFGWSLLIAAAVLFFCSKSSPGYPINDWSDANIYLTIGKGMTRGQVLYRDLYDHKGPLLYALHALCAWISFGDFTGVFVMETLLGAAFLCGIHRLLALYGARRAAWLALPVAALIIYSSYSFAEGDSAEELCLPLMIWALYGALRHFRRGGGRMRAGELVLQGALAGCVLWIKFTLLGVQAGVLLTLLLSHALARDWRGLWRALGWLALGAALSTVPWIVYFGLHGAIGDWLKTYFYDNLFLYSGAEAFSGLTGRLRAMALCGAEWLAGNLRYTPVLLGGLGYFAASRRFTARERLCVWSAALLGALLVFFGGKSYPYYGLALAALAPLGLLPPALWLEKALDRLTVKAHAGLCVGLCAVCVALCSLASPNVRPDYGAPFGQPREETMQYRMAARIHAVPEATLLNYGFMDAGFYTAAGLVPNVKYFHQTNVPLQTMLDEQERYIREGLCDFVITRGKQPDCIDRLYELVAVEKSPNFWYESVYLYRLKALSDR